MIIEAMILFVLFIILGVILGIVHGVWVHRLGDYLREHHQAKWDEMTPGSFLSISTETLESRNYFKEMGFVFSSDDMNDEKVVFLKRRVRLFLF